MVLVQKWPYFQLCFFFFRQYRPGKSLLPYSKTKKRLPRPNKTGGLKRRKIDIIPNELTNGLDSKMAIFPTSFFQAIKARKMFFYDILERKYASLEKKKQQVYLGEKFTFFQRG